MERNKLKKFRKDRLFISKITVRAYGSRTLFALSNSSDYVVLELVKNNYVIMKYTTTDLDKAKIKMRQLVNKYLTNMFKLGNGEDSDCKVINYDTAARKGMIV